MDRATFGSRVWAAAALCCLVATSGAQARATPQAEASPAACSHISFLQKCSSQTYQLVSAPGPARPLIRLNCPQLWSAVTYLHAACCFSGPACARVISVSSIAQLNAFKRGGVVRRHRSSSIFENGSIITGTNPAAMI